MSVKIRLTRVGRKKVPVYRIVVMDSRNRRDGAFIDQIGIYQPKQQPAQFQINEDRAMKWLRNGATPSETVRSLLTKSGIMMRLDLLKKKTSPEAIEAKISGWKDDARARAANRKPDRKKKKVKAETAS